VKKILLLFCALCVTGIFVYPLRSMDCDDEGSSTGRRKDPLLCSEGVLPIHEAAYHGDIAYLQGLLERGALIRAIDHNGRQAVHYAAYSGQLDTLVWLVAHGADGSVRDFNNLLPIRYAEDQGHHHVVSWLQGSGPLKEKRRNDEVIVSYRDILKASYYYFRQDCETVSFTLLLFLSIMVLFEAVSKYDFGEFA